MDYKEFNDKRSKWTQIINIARQKKIMESTSDAKIETQNKNLDKFKFDKEIN